MPNRKALIFTLIFSVVVALSAWGQPELPCDMYLRSARIYLKQSPPDLESALKNLLSSPEKCRQTGEIDFMIGGIYADKNDYEKMVTFFNAALKKDPTLSKKIKDIRESKWGEVFKKGAEFLEKGNDTLAMKNFETAILVDSSRFEAYINAGIGALNLNDSAKAGFLFEKAYKVAPDNLNAKLNYATFLLNRQKFKEASGVLEEVVKLDPKNKEALLNLAMCYSYLGENEKSLTVYKSATVLLEELRKADPKNKDILIDLAMSYARLGENQRSLAIYDTAIALGLGDKDLYFNRGLLKLTQAQEVTKKIIVVRDSMLAKPNDKALVEKSNQLIAEQKKIFASAEPDFKKVVEMDSTDQEGWFQLGFVEWQLEKPADARNALERVTRLYPESKESWELLALVYTKLGLKKEAETALQKAKNP